MPSKKIRLLALDGGGVRGLSSLMILQQLMVAIDPNSPPKPCEFFDMIGGTSTGGLIAIMLGRLQMTIDECINAYISLSDKVFEKKRSRFTITGKVQGRFNAADLEKVVKRIIRERGLDQDALLRDSLDAPCKVFVCAASKQAGHIVCLTSYQNPRGAAHLFRSTKIWQACRATSAATSFFDPIAIGPYGEEFVDGALGANNPVKELWTQAQDTWGEHLDVRLSCLVSIGTGVPLLNPMRDDIGGIFSTLKDIATETEKTSEQFRREQSRLDEEGRYYRFNVDRGLEGIGLEESKRRKEIAAATGRYIELQGTFKQLQVCVAKLTEQEFQCQSRAVRKESKQYTLSGDDHACLQDLRTTDPRDDKGRIETAKGGLLKDAYRWILENDDFITWCNDPDSRLLWIKGDPGKGKTMLLCGIINELTGSVNDSNVVSYFFCQATYPQLNNAVAVLRGLIYLLIDKQPSLISHLRRRYDQTGKQLFEGINAWEALSKIFTAILEDPTLQSVYLVIDALDECTDDLDLLLDLIVRKSSEYPQVRWLVSSRNLPDVAELLDTATRKLKLCLELNEELVSTAVTVYIHHQVRTLTERKKYKDSVREDISNYLLSNAQGTFLWVALVCEGLAKAKQWNARQLLTAFPRGLEPLYERMMERIRDSENAELCKSILGVVSATYRPITLDELPALVDMPDDLPGEDEFLAQIIEACGSLLTRREREIIFIHQSAKDFLLKKASNEIFVEGIKAVHYMIFSRSLQVLKTLRRNIYQLKSPGVLIDQVTKPTADPLAAARYSCLYWVDHLREHDVNDNTNDILQAGDLVEKFLKEKFLNWLEALGLLRGISEGIAAMLKLDSFFQKINDCRELSKRIQDASRFIRYHRVAIEKSPLQVYSSSLIFSPIRSLTRHCYEKDRPQCILNEGAMDNDWSPCLQTLERHSGPVNSIAWSQDGTQLISASHDETIRIWDPATGECMSTLKGHINSIQSIALSQDGTRLASAAVTTIEIWDLATRKCILTLKEAPLHIQSITWLQDGTRLALVSIDAAAGIWDLATKQFILTHRAHSEIHLVAWSQDGSRIALVLRYITILIWDQATGQWISMYRGHSDQIISIAWSQDKTRLASGSEDETIGIWDPAIRQCTSILHGNNGPVRLITWSHDGTRLASASDDLTVRIWDLSTQQCISTLKGHSDLVQSIAWSQDGIRLASASDDQTIRIWDPATKQRTSTPKRWMWIRWSQDKSRLISVSTDMISKIWDPSTGQCISTLKGGTNRCSIFVWSQDASRLAIVLNDKRVKIWDPATGQHKSAFKEDPFSLIHLITWSHDGSRLAVIDDGTVRIWELATEQCISRLKRHKSLFLQVALSQDGSRLALRSYRTVRIWDLSTGQRTTLRNDFEVRPTAWSQDGSRLALVDTKTVRIWDLATGQYTSKLEGHSRSVISIAWSQDGARLVSASGDQTVRAWDPTTGQCVLTVDVDSPTGIQLDPDNSDFLHTKMGTFHLASNASVATSPGSPAPSRKRVGYGFTDDGAWICYGDKNLLWLPPDYRPHSWAVYETTMAIGCSSGCVLVLKLPEVLEDWPLPSIYRPILAAGRSWPPFDVYAGSLSSSFP